MAVKEKFLTSADASRVLGLTPAAVRLIVNQGRLKVAAETESGIRLFRRADVERLARSRAKSRLSTDVGAPGGDADA